MARGHDVHVAVTLGPVLLLAAWAGWSDLRAGLLRRERELPAHAVQTAALLSAAAGAAHATVALPHFAQDVLYGAFFVAAAAGQFLWAAAVMLLPGRVAGLLRAGVLLNSTLLTLWAVTRTAGPPLGAAAGVVEPAGPLDVAVALLELGILGCALMVFLQLAQPAGRRRIRRGDVSARSRAQS